MDEVEKFSRQCRDEVSTQAADDEFQSLTRDWMNRSNALRYSYHFAALGRPIIQYPQDMVAIQELIWRVRPELIIETGIAHGGSLIWSAACLALLDYCDALTERRTLEPATSSRRVIGIDIDIRDHNRRAIEDHPLSQKITMLEGSSTDPRIVSQVRTEAQAYSTVMVFLDSNHTHDHVLAELEAYAPLCTPGSYCVAFDTIVEDLPESMFPDRPWSHGDNPKTAVREYLRILDEEGRTAADGRPLKFAVDQTVEDKLAITVAPEGYLVRLP